jgi:quercetin dioxygenase-like cupin family protein
MTLYCWDSFERRFLPFPVQDHMPSDERVRLTSFQVSKGESLSADVASDELLIYVLRGAWRMKIAGSHLVVRDNEAVIIPSGFGHSAEAIEDSFALRMQREQGAGEGDYMWGV